MAVLCPTTKMIVLKSCFVLQNKNKNYKFQTIGGSDKINEADEPISDAQ